MSVRVFRGPRGFRVRVFIAGWAFGHTFIYPWIKRKENRP